MAKRNRKNVSANAGDRLESNAWVMSTKCVGDKIAGWMVESLYDKNTRKLKSSERCELTSFCYPSGVKLVRAKLHRAPA